MENQNNVTTFTHGRYLVVVSSQTKTLQIYAEQKTEEMIILMTHKFNSSKVKNESSNLPQTPLHFGLLVFNYEYCTCKTSTFISFSTEHKLALQS